MFPNILPARLLTTTLVDFTTMDRNLQNAYSRQASIEVERVARARTDGERGLPIPARRQPLDVGQSERADLRRVRGRTTAAGRFPATETTASTRRSAESDYHGLHLSLVQRPTNWASLRVSYTLSKSMNNVGEAFFSSPVDPTDIMRDWGRSDDDQRHRVVINGTVNSSMAPATTTWERLSHGFQVSTLCSTTRRSPSTSRPASRTCKAPTAVRSPMVRLLPPNFDVRAVTLIPRNAGIGSDFFSLNLRLSRAFPIAGGVKVEGLVEAFNLTNRANPLTRNSNFGPGAYPTNPVATFNQITAVGDPRVFQFGLRLTF